jgi:predicted ATPase
MKPSTLIGHRYELGPRIGAGGMATVFRGLDTHTQQPVALKLLHVQARLDDRQAVERFAREGEALGRLNHPNIVKLLGQVHEGDNHYLVMELEEGGSFDTLCSQDIKLPVLRVIEIALDVCDALVRAHRLGIVHRDLKPANVLIAADGTARLTDFGVARIAGKERLSTTGSIIGTLDYMSPEALSGGIVDARADIWSFGVLIFEALTGTRPFVGAHPVATLHAIVMKGPADLETLRPDCPLALVDLVNRMLEKDCNQRVPSARQVGVALESIAATLENAASRRTRLARFEVAEPQRGERFGTLMFDETLTSGAIVTARPSRLPLQATEFVGRHAELAALAQLLVRDRARLVTIVGPGGMGKSRLAVETCRLADLELGMAQPEPARNDWFQQASAFVELAPLASPDLVFSAIAEAVGFQIHPGAPAPKRQLIAFLARRTLLLVLDNFEHVLPAADLVAEILHGAPGVSVLATSREPLGLSHEQVFSLSGLGVPVSGEERSGDASGIQLFVQSARRLIPDFTLDDDTFQKAAHVCGLLQGMPLGIVLAASWVNVLSLSEIAREIAANVDFLSSDLRDVPIRHKSIRAVFDYSFHLLRSNERAAMARLSVFHGGFTREGAESVALADLRVLAGLTRKSLLSRDPASGRYELHELLRQYADARLRESAEDYERTLDRHSRFFTAFLTGCIAPLQSSNPQPVARVIEDELDNVRSAWRRMLARRNFAETGAVLPALKRFYLLRGLFSELEEIFSLAVAALGEPSPAPGSELARLHGSALVLQAIGANGHWCYERAVDLISHALTELAPFDLESAHACLALALALARSRDPARGVEAGREALRLYAGTSDSWETARAHAIFGLSYSDRLGLDETQALFERSIELQHRIGDGQVSIPEALNGLGDLKVERGHYLEGGRLIREAVTLHDKQGNHWGKRNALASLANALRRQGEYAEAEGCAKEVLALSREFFPFAEAYGLLLLGDVLKESGRLAEASEHYYRCLTGVAVLPAQGEQAQLSVESGHGPLCVALAQLNMGDIAFLQNDFHEARRLLRESLSIFEQLGTTWGVAVALDYLGYLACYEGDEPGAIAQLGRALEVALQAGMLPHAASALAGVARVHFARGAFETACELVAVLRNHPAVERQTLARRVEPLLLELRRNCPEALERAVKLGETPDLDRTARAQLESPLFAKS